MSYESGAFVFLVDDDQGNTIAKELIRFAREAVPGKRVEPIVVSPVGSTIGIDQTRAALAQASLSATPGAIKLVIFEAADTLTMEAQNSLLKKLEDPPANTLFILATRNQYSLLATVRSRCQLMDLQTYEVQGNEETMSLALKLLKGSEQRALCAVSRMTREEGLALTESLANIFERALNTSPWVAARGLWIVLKAYTQLKDNASPGLCLEAMVSRLFELSGLEGCACR
ncbi:MAG TPA: hypothetical protein GXX40_03135 [Firmicutes bacterium]|nr:hypothetical protein [Bacillota bacterium]